MSNSMPTFGSWSSNVVHRLVDAAIADRPDLAFQRAVEATREQQGCTHDEAVCLTTAAQPTLAAQHRAFSKALSTFNFPPLNNSAG